MGKIASLLSAILMASPAVAVAAGIEIPLKFLASGDLSSGSYRPSGRQMLELLPGGPEGTWKLPEVKGPKPVYAFARLGDGRRLFILDGRKDENSLPTRVHFDANGNSDLTDDPVAEGNGNAGNMFFGQIPFPSLKLELMQEGKPVPYNFSLGMYPSEDGFLFPFISTDCCYLGEATLDGKRYRFLLGDLDADGVFGEPGTPISPSEREFVGSRNFNPGDGLAITDKSEFEYRDMTYSSELLLIGDKLFAMRLSIPEKRLTLEPIGADAPRVTLPKDVAQMLLIAEAPAKSITLHRPATSVPLPPGTYRLATCEFLRKDDQGDLWYLAAQATQATPAFTVSTGGPSAFCFGEPYGLTVETSTRKQETRRLFGLLAGPVKKVLSMRLEVKGSAKERVVALERIEGKSTKIPLDPRGTRPRAPSYKILKRGGEVAAQGSFSYG
jgi:hypothetical protein